MGNPSQLASRNGHAGGLPASRLGAVGEEAHLNRGTPDRRLDAVGNAGFDWHRNDPQGWSALLEPLQRIAAALETALPHLRFLRHLPENAEAKEAREHQAYQKLSPAVQLACWSFELAEMQSEEQFTDREAYDWLESNGIPERGAGEVVGYQLPKFETWCRQLREGRRILGESKNSLRHGRPTGKSVVSQHDVEPIYYCEVDDEEEDC